ncbi:DUF1674 domain-containing protein [Methylocystis sp. WRRC1]|uniref:DUF1674 domain-containing protein n=1 Tax=Methylocystis sp. WRRC1 TaxID=1732014 RepID=UPI001D144733|nr:DUF1674 domain-containing protein [Methylocystis sp. WRRC1]MCC3246880.1 DUF1674 domain-containing protein [Methylocystis sp. WRRC1]
MSDAPRASDDDKLRETKNNLPAAAQRALAEAEARRRDAVDKTKATEIGGRGGLDPARFGDWEVKGVASDF